MKRSPSSTLKARARAIVESLYQAYPDAKCALNHSNALDLVVATILSAQCTDARVNIVTKDLFVKYRTADDYAKADPRQFEREVYSTGFFRNKTKSILGMAKLLVERFSGRVPETMDELLELPGVARKTANVVLGTWFKRATGVVVDTHVHRIAHRLKLSRQHDPNKVERDLMELVPQDDWIQFGHMMIRHGRKVCAARSPDCERCPINRWCPSNGKL
jgi:endonuclease-3